MTGFKPKIFVENRVKNIEFDYHEGKKYEPFSFVVGTDLRVGWLDKILVTVVRTVICSLNHYAFVCWDLLPGFRKFFFFVCTFSVLIFF